MNVFQVYTGRGFYRGRPLPRRARGGTTRTTRRARVCPTFVPNDDARASSPTGPESTSAAGRRRSSLARRRRRALGVVSTSSRSIRARSRLDARGIEPRAPPRRSRRADARLFSERRGRPPRRARRREASRGTRSSRWGMPRRRPLRRTARRRPLRGSCPRAWGRRRGARASVDARRGRVRAMTRGRYAESVVGAILGEREGMRSRGRRPRTPRNPRR